MVEHFEAETDIAAAPDLVWPILLDGANYPSWDSGVERVEGTIANGAKIKVISQVSPGRSFPVKVAIDQAAGTMTWTGGMPMGLFTGKRTFTVTPTEAGCHFKMREEYTGPLVRFIWKSIPDLGPSFRQFAEGLKAEAAG
jgi:hypothetical protein